MRFYNGINKLQTASLFPFIFCSAFILIAEVLRLIENNISIGNEMFFYNFSDLLYRLSGYVFCYFITLNLTEKKAAFTAFWSVLCLAVINTAVSSFYDDGTPYIFGIIVAVFCAYCFNRLDRVLSLSLTMICAVLFGVLIGYFIDYWHNFVMSISRLISGKGIFSPVLFSVSDNILSLFGIDTLKDMIFYKSYGGSVVYGGEIVTGVKDLFACGYNGELVSTYLSGHYFMLFALAGLALALFFTLKGVQRYILIAVTVGAVFSGNISIFLLFLFLESPFLFLSVLFIGAIAYLSAYVLQLGMGYDFNGGIVEMIINLNNPVYLFAGGVVFIAIGYFIFKFSFEKHGISDSFNYYIPERLSPFVKSLGGINNIIRYKDDSLEVRNPKLIDTVSIECEINENIVTSKDKRLIELKDYL